jgi:uncharacterized protein YdhG (YjbR/CyaY superfamily)
MLISRNKSGTVDEYVASLPKNVRDILGELRRVVRESAPQAEETMSYGMPTFDLDGRHLVFFAAWKKHVGFYPVNSSVAEKFKNELAPFKLARGSVQFPLGTPIPFDLVGEIVKFRVREVESKK